ncbi:hypothetical protein SB769_36855, partial [Burkholderia sp. SIMBA_024]
PAALVLDASRPQERRHVATLADLASLAGLAEGSAPGVILVGQALAEAVMPVERAPQVLRVG